MYKEKASFSLITFTGIYTILSHLIEKVLCLLHENPIPIQELSCSTHLFYYYLQILYFETHDSLILKINP